MNKLSKYLGYFLVSLVLFSCEKFDITENPAPWIFLERPNSRDRFITSEDTIVKRLDNVRQFWEGDLRVHAMAANGIKEFSIKVNGVDEVFNKDFVPAGDLYHYLKSTNIRVGPSDTLCVINIKVVDFKDSLRTKTIRVHYSIY